MYQIQRACLETLEQRQFLSSTLLTTSTHVNVIGETTGLTASVAGPTIGDVIVQGGVSAAERDTGITLQVLFSAGSAGGISESSLSRAQFRLYNDEIPNSGYLETSNVVTSGGGDTLSVQPLNPLAANTRFRIEINNDPNKTKIKDASGNVVPTTTKYFTTGNVIHTGDPYIKFTKTDQVVTNASYSAVTIGPDHRLYAATLDGLIYSWAIGSTGTLSGETIINTIRQNSLSEGNEGKRFITGITFDPNASASSPVLWVSHGQYKYGSTAQYGSGSQYWANNYTGKISRLSGSGLSTYQDVIVGIPRAVKDHLNNQITFDPAKQNLYFLIPSMTAMGQADVVWGSRPENLFSAAVMRLKLSGLDAYLAANGPINLTCNTNGYPQYYNPYKGSNPLRFFATGIRNAYDMTFAANGRLYISTNGSSAGGNIPAVPSSVNSIPNIYRPDYATAGNYSGALGVSGITKVTQTLDDLLLDVKEGKYYGHPNPIRGEYIAAGGNPTPGLDNDPYEVAQYPSGTQPDRNYVPPAAILGKSFSPNGMITYSSDAFGGLLNGYILITRYNSGQDVIAVKPNNNGTINVNASTLKLNDSSSFLRGTPGMTGFTKPIDLIQDTASGNIYVAQLVTLTGSGKISLLKPSLTNSNAVVSVTKLGLYATPGSSTGATKSVTLSNNGTTGLLVDLSAIKITGANRKSFVITNLPTTDLSLRPGQSYTFNVKFIAAAGQTTTSYGNFAIATSDPDTRYTVVQLRGFPLIPPAKKAAAAVIGATSGSTASAVRPVIQASPNTVYMNAVLGKSSTYIVRIKNIGLARLDLKPGALSVRGVNRASFEILDFPSQGISIVPGRTVYVTIKFKTSTADSTDYKDAQLRIESTDPRHPVRFVALRGLPTKGEGGSLEPSLQKVLSFLNLNISTGQTDIENYLMPKTPTGPNDEVVAQQFVKAGTGSVTIKPMAIFGNDSDPGVRFGYYTPGILDSEKYLWYVPGETTQSVQPLAFGQTSFDPGTKAFGLVGQYPNFTNADSSPRKVYSEDQLNATWDSNLLRHMRIYPLKDGKGNVVANTYIGALEEYTQDYDQQDLIFVITNVKPVTNTPTLSYKNTSGYPSNDWITFNKIGTPDAIVGNTVRDKNTLRLRNSGNADLIVSTAITGDYAIDSGGGTNFVIPAGGKRDVVIRFKATSGRFIHPGDLTLTSNDPNQPSVTIHLSGYYQETSEFDANRRSVEPSAEMIVNDLFGYKTVIRPAGKSLSGNGNVTTIGDELLIPYFKAADTNAAVGVVEIATFHGMTYVSETTGETLPTQSFIGWYEKGKPEKGNIKNIFTDELKVGQMTLPIKKDSGNAIAAGIFRPREKTFGLVVEKREYTDPKLNPFTDKNGVEHTQGHFMRVFPVYDNKGVLVPNSYIVLHDYNTASVNFDYNDNIYLVTNVIPADSVKVPKTAIASATDAGPSINWTSPSDGPKIVGYNIYRSIEARNGFTKLNTTALPSKAFNSYIDSTAVAGTKYYYQIRSVGIGEVLSQPVTVDVLA